MIEISRQSNGQLDGDMRIKVLGLGGAGSNVMDRLVLDGFESAELIVLNTDVQSLTGSVATTKVQLGRTTTRGLGAGGDPESGYHAAQEGADEARAAMEGAQMIFLCVGLGGGTGSGAAPFLAHLAREQGALIIVFATLPFSFEGRRRTAQAEEALHALQAYADAVICFENDKMADVVSPRAGIQEAFSNADQTISQSLRSIALLVQRPGILRVGFDELRTVLRCSQPRCLFGFGDAEGDNRAHTALERALRNPLMDRGRLLENAHNVLVHVVGGPGMTLNEVQILMEELNRHISDQTRLLFGTAVDPRMGNRMSVMLLSSISADSAEHAPVSVPSVRYEPAMPPVIELAPVSPEVLVAVKPLYDRNGTHSGVIEEPVATADVTELVSANLAPGEAPPTDAAPDSVATRLAALRRQKQKEMKQEQMAFEPVTRGRFEKSEPTIVDGQDLDIPTFLRQNVRVK